LPRIIPGLIIILLLLAAGLYRRTPDPDPETYSDTDFIMGTYIRVILGAGEETGEAVSRKIFAEFRRIESIMSDRIPSSPLHRLNTGEIETADDPDLRHVVAVGLRIGAESDWCFNPAVGSLVRLWDVEAAVPRVPPADSIRIALAAVDTGRVLLDGSGVRLKGTGTSLDLGGIAKGYAIDRGLEIIREYRVKAGLIDAGGDIGVVGDRPGGGPWRIGIQHPRDLEKIAGILRLRNRAVATSGDYQRYFTKGGRRYHHIIDPRTGRPARDAVSVTVVGPDAETADALATAAFVLGINDGLALLEKSPGVEGVIIIADTAGTEGALTYGLTPGLKGKLTLEFNSEAD
jgi:thiamine biosynthesis lipoprotein